MQGKLIVFEGIDGCGKDTQIEKLNNRLKEDGFDVIVLSNVSEGPIGKAIRNVLSNHELYISSMQMACLFLSELFIIDKKINELLKENKTIIMSRWFYSTLAYAGSVLKNYLRIKDISDDLICTPDFLIYLDVKPEVSLKRINNRDNKNIEVYENIDRLKKIYKMYESVLGMVTLDDSITKVLRINGENDIDVVSNDIYNELNM